MATVTKFQFDTDFDLQQVETPELEPEVELPPEPTFSEAELEAARVEAFARGREEGLSDARAIADHAVAGAVQAIGEQLATLGSTFAVAWQDCQRDAVLVATALSRKFVPEIIRDYALEMVEGLITDMLPRLLDEPRVVIRVSPALIDPLEERVHAAAAASGFAGKMILLAEDGLAGPDCRIEWADGGAVFETKQVWQDIDEVIRNYLYGVSECGATPTNGDTAAQGGVESDGTGMKTLSQETPNG